MFGLSMEACKRLDADEKNKQLQKLNTIFLVNSEDEKKQLQAQLKELKDLLAELYDESSIEVGGQWLLDRDLQERIKQALKGGE